VSKFLEPADVPSFVGAVDAGDVAEPVEAVVGAEQRPPVVLSATSPFTDQDTFDGGRVAISSSTHVPSRSVCSSRRGKMPASIRSDLR